MDRKRFAILIVCMCLLAVVVSGCKHNPSSLYKPRQELNNVEQIEICTYQDGWPLGTITPFVI